MESQTTSTSLRDRFGALLRNNRGIIFAEVLLIVFVALRIRNGLFLLLLIGWLSLWLRRFGWRTIGLSAPPSWLKTWILGIGLGVLYQLFSLGILVPILHRLTGEPLNLAQLAPLRGNFVLLAISLIASWTVAAFGEEMVFRGFIFNRLADLFGNNIAGWGVALIGSALLFGFGHRYQGLTGIFETMISGAAYAGLYLATKRNLWLSIIVHGIVDTVGFGLIFLGLYP